MPTLLKGTMYKPMLESKECLTHCFAGLGTRVHLIALVTFTFVVAFEVDAYLTAGIGVFALVYVWRQTS